MNSNALAAQKMVVNARFDQQNFRLQQNVPENRHARDPETYDIKEHEILVCKIKQRSTDGTSRVQSAHDGENDWDDHWRFFGVSDNEHRADLKYRMDQGLAVVVGGIAKSFNESGKVIGAGAYLTFDAVSADKPSRVKGIPPTKRRYTFVEYDPTKEGHRKRGVVAKALNNSRDHCSMDVLLLPCAVTR